MGGVITCAQMGDPNASIPTPQPVYSRPMFGAFGTSMEKNSVTFVSRPSIESASLDKLGIKKTLVPVSETRSISKKSMKLNDFCPKIEVNSETYEVRVNGDVITCEPAKTLPMAQRYFMY